MPVLRGEAGAPLFRPQAWTHSLPRVRGEGVRAGPRMRLRESSLTPTTKTPGSWIHIRVDPHDVRITLEDALSAIVRLQWRLPDREMYFDGDEYAICSRPPAERTRQRRAGKRVMVR